MKIYMKIMEVDPRARYEVLVEIVNAAIESDDQAMINLLCTNHDRAMLRARQGFKSESKKL